jgi:hypothetical protein
MIPKQSMGISNPSIKIGDGEWGELGVMSYKL